jgi:hypothetical protein
VSAPSGLVAWYRAENNASDSSGNNNNGTVGISTTFAAGKVGQAFQVTSATGSTVTVPDSPSLDFTNAFTIEMWVSTGQLGANNGTSFLACKGNCGTFGDQPYSLLYNASGSEVAFRAGNSSTFDTLFSSALPINNTFSHLAATYDNPTMKIYVNGVLSNSLTTTIGTLVNSNLPFSIGGSINSGNALGVYDETSLYNRALSDAEILSIFNAGSAGKCFTPTAAAVQISGRVTTAKGIGIGKATVSLIASSGETRAAVTDSFGYYSFEDAAAGETYILSVKHKHYQFASSSSVLLVNEEINNLNFTALPLKKF